ncbi:acyltransferase family protein [Aurantiacibacter sp. MUD61]|uniref:acyltransferase family protein n=1 Tax=Aurantiacibacter sp. MUD61 TaxID=3009083 RepID=UPI0022F140B5|nr:acyltransferase [Aurantiacibacter sp. MUD61]
MSIWAKARSLAEKAPPERNRYVDFLRAFSILAVVIGHWLVAAPYIDASGEVVGGHLLGILPWSQWLTWGFQVMPLFFLVGGFSNGVSWAAQKRDGKPYSAWFASRIQRLINPVFPVLLFWAALTFVGTQAGLDRDVVNMAAQLALIPVWFLAVYLFITALTPIAHAAWQRFGWGSIAALVLAAVAVDIARIGYAVAFIGWANFAFVWLAVHQLGFAWGNGELNRGNRPWLFLATWLSVLIALVTALPYPIAMIGVPGADLSNSMPPTLALLSLGFAQAGLALGLEKAGRRMLDNIQIWTGVVLMNGMIMTVYLWHLTAFVAVLVAAWLLGGIGLDAYPGTGEWWLARPVWFALYIATLLPLIAIFARYERGSALDGKPLPHWQLVLGLVLISLGLAMTAAISIASPEGVSGVRLWVVALPLVGAALVGFGPVAKWLRS